MVTNKTMRLCALMVRDEAAVQHKPQCSPASGRERTCDLLLAVQLVTSGLTPLPPARPGQPDKQNHV